MKNTTKIVDIRAEFGYVQGTMDEKIRQELRHLAGISITDEDPAHNLSHAHVVCGLAETIQRREGGDLDVIVPAALFHDVNQVPKNHSNAQGNAERSAVSAGELLEQISYPRDKIPLIQAVIRLCSVSHGAVIDTLEAGIVSDADILTSLGAEGIARFCMGAGRHGRRLYTMPDPFCRRRPPVTGFVQEAATIDTLLVRMHKMQRRLYTDTGKGMAKPRIEFVELWMKRLETELREAGTDTGDGT